MATKKKSNAFSQPVEFSQDLQTVVGAGPLPRTEIIKKLWEYIRKHNCQDRVNKRNIIPDANLAKIFGSSKPIDMFQMTKKVSLHIKK